ncbi:hypothetical protein BJ878DRAFT_81697 [Calycina marina]|uniref:Uncharacterized protein n=1 Tax=Calycina marina TaxID=1763456 RepID=A0A9P8CEK6_9HELO|nr:hypothetical protein BJ878DRAFT_81697 [Calycina marina]
MELGGTKIGKQGNRTQSVIYHLLDKLPGKMPDSLRHCYLDNLLLSTEFVLFMRSIKGGRFGVTVTCRPNDAGVFQKLVDFKASDQTDTIPWGTTYALCTLDKQVAQVGFKDNAFVLFMSSVLDGKATFTECASDLKGALLK